MSAKDIWYNAWYLGKDADMIVIAQAPSVVPVIKCLVMAAISIARSQEELWIERIERNFRKSYYYYHHYYCYYCCYKRRKSLPDATWWASMLAQGAANANTFCGCTRYHLSLTTGSGHSFGKVNFSELGLESDFSIWRSAAATSNNSPFQDSETETCNS